jgi:hypothetical protein
MRTRYQPSLFDAVSRPAPSPPWAPPPPFAAPRIATPGDPTRPTYGPKVAALAAALRRPFMPWQRLVADVAGEVDPATGRLVYGTVIVSVPRRAGKSILTLATSLQRMELLELGRAWYTAQTGTDASTTFRDAWAPIVVRSVLASAYKVRLSNGSQSFTSRHTGSMLSIFAPTESAVHGQDVDIATIDEAWALTITQGDAVENAVSPAMATRPYPQLWVVSAGGTEDSTYWDQHLTRAEEHVAAGGRDGVALFDWGAGPDDDPADPATWVAAHPAVGHTIDVDFLRERRTSSTFERAYLNRWARPSSMATTGVVDPGAWSAAVDTLADLAGPVVVGFDVAPDRSSAAVAAAAQGPDGRVLVTIVDHRPQVGWLAGRVADVPAAVSVIGDSLGGAATGAALAARGVPVDLVSASDLARACSVFVDAVHDGRLIHHAQAPLDDALAGAARRWFGDAWAWSRLRSDVDITPLVAATLAVYGVIVRSPGPGEIY